MTYGELAAVIAAMTPEQRQQDVTVFVCGVGEYYPLANDSPFVETDAECDALDEGHPVLII